MSAPLPSIGGVLRHEILGVPVAALTLEQAVQLAEAAIVARVPLHFGMVNAAKIVHMRRDPLLAHDLLASDVVLADGMPVVWASHLFGRPLPERVAGIDLMAGLLALAARKGYSAYCLGATKPLLDQAVRRMVHDHPGLRVAGAHDGYFDAASEERVALEIAAAAPDILFVGMTSPKKERFMAQWSDGLGVPVVHGVGGAFDVLAGRVRRAPRSWQQLGLEWAYRLRQEPGRLWRRYLVTNTLFCGLVAAAILRRALTRD